MIDIKNIPFGRKNAVSKEYLMEKAGINNEAEFERMMLKLDRKYCICIAISQYDLYFYRPTEKKEYLKIIKNNENSIKLCKKEMERFEL